VNALERLKDHVSTLVPEHGDRVSVTLDWRSKHREWSLGVATFVGAGEGLQIPLSMREDFADLEELDSAVDRLITKSPRPRAFGACASGDPEQNCSAPATNDLEAP
jgi:hypothetical protein